jgi:hypothetical protein
MHIGVFVVVKKLTNGEKREKIISKTCKIQKAGLIFFYFKKVCPKIM